MPEIISEQKVLDGRLVVEKAILSENGETFERLRVARQNASAILLYDSGKDRVILTRQYRYPVAAQSQNDILEIVAGKIDSGEQPSEAALREIEEETGYRIRVEKLRYLTACFASPGYSTEQFFIFGAEVTDADRVSGGGGLAEEHEKIELAELSRDTFLAQVKDGTIRDAKTIIAALLFFTA